MEEIVDEDKVWVPIHPAIPVVKPAATFLDRGTSPTWSLPT